MTETDHDETLANIARWLPTKPAKVPTWALQFLTDDDILDSAHPATTESAPQPERGSSAGQRLVEVQKRSEGSILTRVGRALRWTRSLSIGPGR